jgi:hypothetical protein
MVPIDGSASFDWRLGLAPGSYHLAAVEFPDRGRKVMPVQVDPAGSNHRSSRCSSRRTERLLAPAPAAS